MIAYCITTYSRYVLVRARDVTEALEFGEIALRKFYLSEEIETFMVREASKREIQLWDWHNEITEAETVRN